MLHIVERFFAFFFTPPVHLYDPVVALIMGLFGVAMLWGTPVALFVWIVAWCNRPASQAWTAVGRARLQRRDVKRRGTFRKHLQKIHARQEAYARQRARLTQPAGLPVVALGPPEPFTPAQQTFYNDMRAKGWSALATQQAVERLSP